MKPQLKKHPNYLLIYLGIIPLVIALLFSDILKNPFETPIIKERFYVSSFTPDSTGIYFEFADLNQKVRIGWMDLTTQRVSLFELQDTQNQLASPRSSLDGRQIVLVAKEAANHFETSQIGVIDLKDARYRAITNSPSYKQFPSFSRDGKKIIYAQSNRIRESGKTRFSDWDIYEVEVDSGIEKRLTHFCFYSVNDPFYLDDGKKFVFSGEPSGCKDSTQHPSSSRQQFLAQYQENTIFVMEAGEQILKPLLINGTLSDGAFWAQGDKIFFVSRTNEMDGLSENSKYNYDIFVYEGGAIKRLTNLKTLLTGLVAAPKGDWVAYMSDPLREHSRQYQLMNIRNGESRPLYFGDSKLFQVIKLTGI